MRNSKMLQAAVIASLLASAAGASPAADAAEPYRLYVNETSVPAAPYRQDGELMLPLRPLMDALGFAGAWSEDGTRFTVQAGPRTVIYEPGSRSVVANSAAYVRGTAAAVRDGKLYVPAESVRADLRLELRWSAATGAVVVESPPELYIASLAAASDKLAYAGETRGGVPHGQGVWKRNGVVVYEGAFASGTMHGQGKLYRNGALLYEGAFAHGRAEGIGTLYESSGRHYVGSFARSLPNGQGSWYVGDRLAYAGEWKDGVMEGAGRLYDEEGQLVYDGELRRGLRVGFGVAYEDGRPVYAGDWIADRRSGHGKAFDAEGGTAYIGGWKDGEKHGSGFAYESETITLYESDGRTILGERRVDATLATPVVHTAGKLASKGDPLLYFGLDAEERAALLDEADVPETAAGEDPLNGFAEIRTYAGKRATEAGVVYESERLYIGQVKDGVLHGYGRQYDDGRLAYAGDFANGLRDGEGKSYADGMVTYDGQWRNGVRHGYGRTFVYDEANPNVAALGIAKIEESTFRDGTPVALVRKLEYYGDIANGTLNGRGSLFARNAAGRLEKWYEGGFLDGKYSGAGTLYSGKAVVYEGDFADGLRSGTGTEYSVTNASTGASVVLYRGPFRNDAYHGEGALYYPSGYVRYRGRFENGLMHGVGRLFYDWRNAGVGTTGTWYEGTFKRGAKHGYGKLYDTSGRLVYEGEFVNDETVK
ncbi:stalk domain-containing protein [Paenibacillus sp.]|uniref:stalk domain-containing protein n=1 Tax=Paenibacillus sp. TaxID=58172 RepID=UPI002D6C4CEF|nr:stalk domain-containing protein [Paenibacillus sp.]HZG56369.1 stalk domain-containing protein [Paenibacillus sp.]